MMKRFLWVSLLSVFATTAAAQGGAPEPQELQWFYADGHGGFVYFPLGDASFADKVVTFESGKPAARSPKDRVSSNALRAPDYNVKTEAGYLTLGCGGTLVTRFTDNALVDIKGPDLYVFEIGDSTEPTALSISVDGKQWIEVGSIAGGRAEVDIRSYTEKDEIFSYVKLTDLKSDCGAGTPGADIDAIGAIGSGARFRFGSEVLFDVGKAELKPEAETELKAISDKINAIEDTRIVIEGHTDSVGTEANNQILSEQRAQSVKTYMEHHSADRSLSITAVGYGEKRPIAENNDTAGRQKNRRVEMIVIPTKKADDTTNTPSIFDGTWLTAEGPITLAGYAQGTKLVGRYAEDNGRAYFNVKQNVASGYWIEDDSSQACRIKRDNSLYWGRMELTLNDSQDAYDGWWSYCDTDMVQGQVSASKKVENP
jgi:outer membrane protein OmpA-like peptidoglycan-associated protein